jgi:hypothetical protein
VTPKKVVGTIIAVVILLMIGYVLGRCLEGRRSGVDKERAGVVSDFPQCDPLCVVSFDSLVNNADIYEGQIVSTIAYLTVTDGVATLHAREEDYLSGVGDLRALRFRQNSGDLARTLKKHVYQYVYVSGRFHADPGGRRGDRVGNIFVENVGNYMTEDRPESIESFSVPAEDL